jgi:hypothetical protein
MKPSWEAAVLAWNYFTMLASISRYWYDTGQVSDAELQHKAGHCVNLEDTTVLARMTGYMDHVVKEATEILL